MVTSRRQSRPFILPTCVYYNLFMCKHNYKYTPLCELQMFKKISKNSVFAIKYKQFFFGMKSIKSLKF